MVIIQGTEQVIYIFDDKDVLVSREHHPNFDQLITLAIRVDNRLQCHRELTLRLPPWAEGEHAVLYIDCLVQTDHTDNSSCLRLDMEIWGKTCYVQATAQTSPPISSCKSM